MNKKTKGLIIIPLAAALVLLGCRGEAGGTSQQSGTSTLPTWTAGKVPDQPIEVVSVRDTYRAGETVTPAGPTIEITLKNVSSEAVVSLNVALEESGPRNYSFDFGVSPSNLLPPSRNVSARQTLIGGGWGSGISYSLSISGAFRSGETFAFTWKPSNTDDAEP